MSIVQQVDDSRFEAAVLQSPRPVVADFSATWCGPCKRLEPIIEALAVEFQGRVDVVKVDVDSAQETAARYGIMSVPSVLFFKGGALADQIAGLTSREELVKRLEPLLEA